MRRSPLTRCLVLTAPLVFSACATIGPPQPPSLELPKPPADLRAVRKGDRVVLTWTIPTSTTDRQTIRTLGPTQICRSVTDLKDCGNPVGETRTRNPVAAQSSKQKLTASYADKLPADLQSDMPSASITYAVEVLNRGRRGAGISNRVRVSLTRTLPPPTDFQAQVTAQGIVLSWANNIPAVSPEPSIHYLYRVYRREQGAQQAALVGEVQGGSDPRVSLTDTAFEWQKTYDYHAEAVTVIAEPNKPEIQVEGDDTPTTTIFANDTFPPGVPSGLQAVYSGPGQQPFIDLVWAPVTDIDLAGYNVYRHEEEMAATKLNAELVKTPAYRDTSVVSGKRYIYAVTAVDVHGNESALSGEANEAVP